MPRSIARPTLEACAEELALECRARAREALMNGRELVALSDRFLAIARQHAESGSRSEVETAS